jgi:hypothetical protein
VRFRCTSGSIVLSGWRNTFVLTVADHQGCTKLWRTPCAVAQVSSIRDSFRQTNSSSYLSFLSQWDIFPSLLASVNTFHATDEIYSFVILTTSIYVFGVWRHQWKALCCHLLTLSVTTCNMLRSCHGNITTFSERLSLERPDNQYRR